MYNFYFCNFIWYGCKKLSWVIIKRRIQHHLYISQSSHNAVRYLDSAVAPIQIFVQACFCHHLGSQASVPFFVWFPFITFCGLWSAMEWSLNKFLEESSGTGRFLVADTSAMCLLQSVGFLYKYLPDLWPTQYNGDDKWMEFMMPSVHSLGTLHLTCLDKLLKSVQNSVWFSWFSSWWQCLISFWSYTFIV